MDSQTDQKNIKTNFNDIPIELLEVITTMTPVKVYQALIVKAYDGFSCDEECNSELILTISKDGDDYFKIDKGLIFHREDFDCIITKFLTSKLKSWIDSNEVHIQITIGGLLIHCSHHFDGFIKEYVEDAVEELMLALEENITILGKVWKWSK